MLRDAFFTPADTAKFEAHMTKMKKITIGVLVFGALIDLAICYFVTLDYRHLFLPVLAGLFLLTFIMLRISLFKIIGLYKKDMADQMKLKGEVKVLSKTIDRGIYTIMPDSDEVKRLVTEKKFYDQVQPGEMLSIEVTKQAKYLLRMEKYIH
jgi:hypothetical protein